MDKEEIEKKLQVLTCFSDSSADDLLKLTAYFGATLSFLKAKLSETDFNWCLKWIVRIMDIVDMEYCNEWENIENRFFNMYDIQIEELGYIGNADIIKHIMFEFKVAKTAFGELLCRYKKGNLYLDVDTTKEIEGILKMMEKRKENETVHECKVLDKMAEIGENHVTVKNDGKLFVTIASPKNIKK